MSYYRIIGPRGEGPYTVESDSDIGAFRCTPLSEVYSVDRPRARLIAYELAAKGETTLAKVGAVDVTWLPPTSVIPDFSEWQSFGASGERHSLYWDAAHGQYQVVAGDFFKLYYVPREHFGVSGTEGPGRIGEAPTETDALALLRSHCVGAL